MNAPFVDLKAQYPSIKSEIDPAIHQMGRCFIFEHNNKSLVYPPAISFFSYGGISRLAIRLTLTFKKCYFAF
jgi:hypothetical protein